MKDYEDLSDRIGANRCSMVINLLNKNTNLDLMYDNGTFFKMAIENNSHDIIKVLLDYFEENQLSAYKENSYEYSILKGKMRDILKFAINSVELSSETQKVLSSYLDFHDYRLIHASADGNLVEVQELLKNDQIEIDLKEEIWGNTALHLAYQNGHYDVVKLLIQAGADQDITNDKGLIAKEVDKLQYINEEQCQNVLSGLTQLENIKNSNIDKIKWLLNQPTSLKKYNSSPDLSSTFEHSQEFDILSLDKQNVVHTTGELFNFTDDFF